MKKLNKRILSIVLVLAMVLTFLPTSNVSAADKFEVGATREFHVQNVDGDYLYKMQVSKDKQSFQLDMTKTSTGDMTTVVFNDGVATTYKTTTKSFFDLKSMSADLVSKVDFSNTIKMAENSFSAQGYRSLVGCIVPTLAGNNLWYQMGSTSPDVGYMLMGCDWSYRILADANASCAVFRNKIVESNTLVAESGVGASSAVMIGIAILAAGLTGGFTVALTFGLTTTAATKMVAACNAEMVAHDNYDIAKKDGVRQ